jgi:hypothetical protein
VILCTIRAVPLAALAPAFAALAPARPADREADTNDRLARLAFAPAPAPDRACVPVPAPESPMQSSIGPARTKLSAPGVCFLAVTSRPCAGTSQHAEEWVTVSPTTTRHPELDQACADAVDLARQAVEDDAGAGQVGEHVGVEVEADRVVTHLFTCLSPAYVGWHWAVTVNRASRSKIVTVSECVLLPGPDALLAPDWVPWTERVRPGDLKAGDLMPASSDDERLVPLVALVGEPGLLDWDEDDAWSPRDDLVGGELLGGAIPAEIGQLQLDTETEEPPAAASLKQPPAPVRRRNESAVRRRRVLSAIGRDEAAVRWHGGDQGPNTPLAQAAPACCITCGFMVRLNGPLGRVFGVCANEYAPDDGRVVAVDHGCGAHSDGDVAPGDGTDATPPVDELGYDMLSAEAPLPDSVLENIDHELN